MSRRITTSISGLGLLVLGLLFAAPSTADSRNADPASMSIDEMEQSAKQLVGKMEEILTMSFKLLEQSISSSDVAATAIRNEAITAMKGLVKLSEENYITLQQKRAEQNRDAVEHEFVKISIASAKVKELFAQVKTAGGIDVDIEAIQVESTLDIESSIPVDSETYTEFGSESVDVLPDPPSHASPVF
jgi:hypothetical protein